MSQEAYSALLSDLQKSLSDSGTSASAITRDFEQIIEAAPTAEYYLKLGLLYAQQRNAEKAARVFHQGLLLDPKNIHIRLAWSNIEAEQSNLERALDFRIQASGLLEQLQRTDEARLTVTEALGLPGITSFQSCTGLAYLASFEMRQKQLAAAFAALDEARSINPKHPLVLMVLGQLQFIRGEYAQAERTLQDAVEAAESIVDKPDWLSRTLASKATLLTESGRHREAEVLYIQAIDNCRAPEALAAYAYCLALRQEVEQAEQLIEEAIGNAPANAEVYYLHRQILEHKQLLTVTSEKALLSEWEVLRAAYSVGGGIDVDRCQHALAHLLAKCDCQIVSPFSSIDNRFLVAELDISRIFDFLKIRPRVPVVVMMKDWKEEDFTLLLNKIRLDMQGVNHVIVLLFDTENIEGRMEGIRNKFLVYARELAVLTYSDVRYLLLHPKSADTLRRRLLLQFQIRRLSPYQTDGPVTGRVFVGRDRELEWICNRIGHMNLALVGGRKIGKTTILLQLEKARLPQVGLVPFYYDCAMADSLDSIVEGTAKAWLKGKSSRIPRTFDRVLSILSQSVPSPVVLLDEADRLVALDRQNDYFLLRAARGYSHLNKCHFVLCGERALQSELQSAPPRSPLHNFGETYTIGCLDKPAVVELVKMPMQQLGIELIAPDRITHAVWGYTSGHPSIVQWICEKAVTKLEHENRRLLRQSDIEDIATRREFIKYFTDTIWKGSTTLERICAYTIALDQTLNSEPLLYDALRSHGLKVSRIQVDAALERLADLRGILNLSHQKCEIAMSAFIKVIKKIEDIDYEIRKWIEAYEQQGDVVPESQPDDQSMA